MQAQTWLTAVIQHTVVTSLTYSTQSSDMLTYMPEQHTARLGQGQPSAWFESSFGWLWVSVIFVIGLIEQIVSHRQLHALGLLESSMCCYLT